MQLSRSLHAISVDAPKPAPAEKWQQKLQRWLQIKTTASEHKVSMVVLSELLSTMSPTVAKSPIRHVHTIASNAASSADNAIASTMDNATASSVAGTLASSAYNSLESTGAIDGAISLAGTGTVGLLQHGFELGSTIGEGSFSKVRLATHTLSSRTVAVKCIAKAECPAKLVLQEILLLCSLQHPNINPMLEIIDTPSTIHIVTPHHPSDLYDCITTAHNARLAETLARTYFRQITRGLAHIHSKGIVHRDMKPENILIDKHNCARICDFGFASTVNHDQLDSMHGSPEYLAPEIVARKPYGQQVDIWALGVILFVMLTGLLPFPHKNNSKLFLAILAADFVVPETVSQEAKALIQSILKTAPSSRSSLEYIRTHSWTNCDCDETLSFSEIPTLVGNKPIIATLLQYGFMQEDVEEYFKSLQPGPIKTAAYLLEDRIYHPELLEYMDKIQPAISPDNFSYPLTSQTQETIKLSLLGRLKSDRSSGQYSQNDGINSTYSDAQPKIPVCMVYIPVEGTPDFLNKLSARFNTRKIDQSGFTDMHKVYTWIPESPDFDLLADFDLVQMLTNQLHADAQDDIKFKVKVDFLLNNVTFTLVGCGGHWQWAITQFQELVAALTE